MRINIASTLQHLTAHFAHVDIAARLDVNVRVVLRENGSVDSEDGGNTFACVICDNDIRSFAVFVASIAQTNALAYL